MAQNSVFEAIGSYSRHLNSATAADLSANITSGRAPATGELFNFSYQFWVATGTPTGTFIVEVSNDRRLEDVTAAASAQWTIAASVAFAAGVGPDGLNSTAVLVQNGWYASRCRWVFGSGTGTGFCYGCGVQV